MWTERKRELLTDLNFHTKSVHLKCKKCLGSSYPNQTYRFNLPKSQINSLIFSVKQEVYLVSAYDLSSEPWAMNLNYG